MDGWPCFVLEFLKKIVSKNQNIFCIVLRLGGQSVRLSVRPSFRPRQNIDTIMPRIFCSCCEYWVLGKHFYWFTFLSKEVIKIITNNYSLRICMLSCTQYIAYICASEELFVCPSVCLSFFWFPTKKMSCSRCIRKVDQFFVYRFMTVLVSLFTASPWAMCSIQLDRLAARSFL